MTRKKCNDTTNFPTSNDVETFKRIVPLLEKLNSELSELSKKKPDDKLNKLKVKMVNQVLTPLKEMLSMDPNIAFLELLDDESLPSNSDALFITGQFLTVLEQFKSRFHGYDEVSRVNRWHTKENP